MFVYVKLINVVLNLNPVEEHNQSMRNFSWAIYVHQPFILAKFNQEPLMDSKTQSFYWQITFDHFFTDKSS